MRPNLGRLSTIESLGDAWCDPIRVLIRVLAGRDRNGFADTFVAINDVPERS